MEKARNREFCNGPYAVNAIKKQGHEGLVNPILFVANYELHAIQHKKQLYATCINAQLLRLDNAVLSENRVALGSFFCLGFVGTHRGQSPLHVNTLRPLHHLLQRPQCSCARGMPQIVTCCVALPPQGPQPSGLLPPVWGAGICECPFPGLQCSQE